MNIGMTGKVLAAGQSVRKQDETVTTKYLEYVLQNHRSCV